MTELMPNIKKILKIFEPITFPIAISLFFLKAATSDVTSSGREVPIETMVRPISFSLTPRKVAIATDLSTTNLLPKIKAVSPEIMNAIDQTGLYALTYASEPL